VKSLVPVLAAGGTFAVSSLAGLGIGILLADRSGQPMWVLGGLLMGLAIGAFSAFQLLRQSM
jgi:hypothetical protein